MVVFSHGQETVQVEFTALNIADWSNTNKYSKLNDKIYNRYDIICLRLPELRFYDVTTLWLKLGWV